MTEKIVDELEKLLCVATTRNCYNAVLLLINFVDHLETFNEENHLTKYPYGDIKASRAVVLAAHHGNYQILKLLLSRGFSLQVPHLLDCHCNMCLTDKLGQTRKRIESMQALVNPVWIALTSSDPFLSTFKICESGHKLSQQEDCFEKTYNTLIMKSQRFCFDLLDQLESENEVQCLMKSAIKHKQYPNLGFIKLAIKYEQKEVVSHPILQHVLASLVFGSVPKWRTSGWIYKICLILSLSLLYPVTSLIHLLLPCSHFGRLAADPLIKFINGAASFLTYLVILACIAAFEKTGIRAGAPPNVLDCIMFVWNIALMIQEIRQLMKEGKQKYFSCGWNWIDIFMVALTFTSYIMWIIIYLINPHHTDESLRFAISFADGFFALGIVLSFFRLVYLCQINRFLGLLQLCLGRMLQVIFQFAFISCVVLCSFSVGMLFLFQSSLKRDEMMRNIDRKEANQSTIHTYLSGGYNGLVPTMITLAWASMNMADLKSLNGLDDGTMIHLWSYFLFTLYHGVSMIVLLNMLIAMMSNSYQQIESNIEVEHKYARTTLWLEYIGDDNVLPCPFNLIPTYDIIKRFYTYFYKLWKKNDNVWKESKKTQKRRMKNEYERLCKTLLSRYLSNTMGIHLNEDEPQPDYSGSRVFVTKVKAKIKLWTNILTCLKTKKELKLLQTIPHKAVNEGYDTDDESCTELDGSKDLQETYVSFPIANCADQSIPSVFVITE